MTTLRRPLVGVAIIVRRHGRFLLIKRGKEPNFGCWAFPGGHQEFGETVAMAAERELFEETGVTGANTRLVTVLDAIDGHTDAPRYHYTLIVMAVDWVAGEGKADGDADSVGWFAPDAVERMAILPSAAALIRSLSHPPAGDMVNKI